MTNNSATTMDATQVQQDVLGAPEPGRKNDPSVEVSLKVPPQSGSSNADRAKPSAASAANAPSKQPTAEVSADKADDGADAAKPGLVQRGKRWLRNSWRLSVACLLSALGGMGITWCMVVDEPAAQVSEDSNAEAPRYVAALSRRHEPIRPLVPFEDLNPDVVSLGRKLFHDPALSGNGRVSCASCHQPAAGGDDGLKRSLGLDGQPGSFNAPTVLNAALNCQQSWDGRSPTLEQHVDGPLTDPAQMGSDWERILKYLTTETSYLREFRTHMEGDPTQERVREAIATYERSLITVNSPFDQWLGGDESALGTEALSGYYTFHKLNCVACHQGELVGGSMFQPLGDMRKYFTAKRQLDERDWGRFHVTKRDSDRFVFRVPGLRNAELTAPYFHDGSAATLEDAVEAMIRYQVGQEPNDEEVRRIAIFLRTLTGDLPE